jgi:hypothetical protein
MLFVAANTQAMIYDWKANTERRLPDIPNGVRVTYPMAAGAVMLPLTPANRYTPEILICGGSTSDDTIASYEHTSQEPASDQCVRMVLDEDGIDAGWQVERMPEARLMPDLVLLPTGGRWYALASNTSLLIMRIQTSSSSTELEAESEAMETSRIKSVKAMPPIQSSLRLSTDLQMVVDNASRHKACRHPTLRDCTTASLR